LRKSPVVLLVFGIFLTMLVGFFAALATGLALAVAWVLTLLLDGMTMPQAMTPAAILAVAALYVSFKLLIQRIQAPIDGEGECDACRECNLTGDAPAPPQGKGSKTWQPRSKVHPSTSSR
jgi:hypothetical protein